MLSGVRATLSLAYLLCLYVVAWAVSGFWYRHSAPLWQTTLRDARTGYDAIGAVNLLLGLLVAFGLMRRQEWARVFCIMLAVLVAFFKIGIPLVTPLITGLSLADMIEAVNLTEALVVTLLAVTTIVALLRPSFKAAYSGREMKC